jgi:hypothetical protein
MKPLPRIKEIQNGVKLESLSPNENRKIFIAISEQPFGSIVRLTDGTMLNVTLKANNDILIEKIEPYYEFDDENEIRKYLTIDNEEFENFVRWQKLKNILSEEDDE